jgi:hypothetical protein
LSKVLLALAVSLLRLDRFCSGLEAAPYLSHFYISTTLSVAAVGKQFLKQSGVLRNFGV